MQKNLKAKLEKLSREQLLELLEELCNVPDVLDRIRLNPNFLESRCQSTGSSEFSFDWSPGELFGQQLGS